MISAAAPLGHDARQQFVAPTLADSDFDARKSLFELVQKTNFADTVVVNLAFLLRRFDGTLPLGCPGFGGMNAMVKTNY